jgi:Spy/CpxP family protein refolding chaperone
MRAMLKFAMVVCLAVGLVGMTVAQQRQGGGGFGGPLVQNASVQKELKLTDEQVSKLKDALAKVRENHKDDVAKLKDLSKEERREQGTKVFRAISEESNKAIAGILETKQLKRLKQIELQRSGYRAFINPEVQKSLKLTDEQKDKLKTIAEDAGKQMRELRQGGKIDAEGRKKLAELTKETKEKVVGVLTDEQKKSWKEMTGEPFEVKFEPRQPRKNK